MEPASHFERVRQLSTKQVPAFLLLQLVCLTTSYFLALTLVTWAIDLVSEKHFSFGQIFSTRAFDFRTHFIGNTLGSLAVSTPVNIGLFLLYCPKTSKVAGQFLTLVFFHLIGIALYSRQLPGFNVWAILALYASLNVLVIQCVTLRLEQQKEYRFGGTLEITTQNPPGK